MEYHIHITFSQLGFLRGHSETRKNSTMNFSQKMRTLSVLAFLACVAMTAASEKESVCCKEASSKKITAQITGFKLQQPKPPCVKAVIFYTSEGAVCSHWRESWVANKVKELRKLQANEKRLNTTPAPQKIDSTYSSNTTLNY